jgi:hypothetical protein
VLPFLGVIMDLKLAEILVEVLGDDGVDASLRESYSGRGMYGKDTAGVVIGDVTDLLAAIINNASMFCEEEDEMFYVNGFKQDSMGKGMIIY